MEEKRKQLKLAFWLFTVSIFIFVIICSVFMLYCAYNQSFGINRTDWLSLFLAYISLCSTVFLGFIAYWQNERFKVESDITSEKTEEKNDEYQSQLLQINNRIMKLEENKEYAYIAFMQTEVLVANFSSSIHIEGKSYSSIISNSDKKFKDATIFIFSITNQTNIPIRYFQLKKMIVEYSDFINNTRDKIISYGKGGFVASPIISKGEIVHYTIIADELRDLVENLPDGMEITLTIDVEVTSIFDRTIIQTFLLRLQKHSPFLISSKNDHLFWNYCCESSPNRK